MAPRMNFLSSWSFRRTITVAVGWVFAVIVIALLTPTGRFVYTLYRLRQTLGPDGSIGIEFPVSPTAIRIWWIATPVLALVPAIGLLTAWRLARHRGADQAAA